MPKKQQKLTPEQLIIGKMQRLQANEGWKHIIDGLTSDKEALIKQLVYDFKGTDGDKQFSQADIRRYRIELIEDIILMPQTIINEHEPVLPINTPDT